MKSLAEQVLELEGKYRLLRAGVEGVVLALDTYSKDNPSLKIVTDQLKEVLEEASGDKA